MAPATILAVPPSRRRLSLVPLPGERALGRRDAGLVAVLAVEGEVVVAHRRAAERSVPFFGHLDVGAQVDDVGEAVFLEQCPDRAGRQVLQVVGPQQAAVADDVSALGRQAAEVSHVDDAAQVDPAWLVHLTTISDPDQSPASPSWVERLDTYHVSPTGTPARFQLHETDGAIRR